MLGSASNGITKNQLMFRLLNETLVSCSSLYFLGDNIHLKEIFTLFIFYSRNVNAKTVIRSLLSALADKNYLLSWLWWIITLWDWNCWLLTLLANFLLSVSLTASSNLMWNNHGGIRTVSFIFTSWNMTPAERKRIRDVIRMIFCWFDIQ